MKSEISLYDSNLLLSTAPSLNPSSPALFNDHQCDLLYNKFVRIRFNANRGAHKSALV